ncbi:MAG: hypothetical protein IPK19_07275 [Chloroflexi bacterium]|nr:hypothetical protein [Chloroflexota bacterium]
MPFDTGDTTLGAQKAISLESRVSSHRRHGAQPARLGVGRGGMSAQCEWGINVPRANIEAVFEAWLE